MKYVIENCPAYSCNGICCADSELYCKDYNSCTLKRIVDECKKEIEIPLSARGDLAERILSELEIEEVNEE